MRIVNKESEFENAWNSAKAESEASFSNSGLYLEKFIVCLLYTSDAADDL